MFSTIVGQMFSQRKSGSGCQGTFNHFNVTGFVVYLCQIIAAAEIGADIVKTYYTGDPDSFAEVVAGCMVPVVILGGAKSNSIEDVFSDVYFSIQAGGSGIAIGRNIWQHKNTRAMIEAMAGVVHEGWSVKQAMAYI